jgi:hypothetical protein
MTRALFVVSEEGYWGEECIEPLSTLDEADVDVTVAERALFDRVDLAALDDLFAPSGRGRAAAGASLSFGIWTYAVTVRADGAIEIRDTRQPGPESTYSPHPR